MSAGQERACALRFGNDHCQYCGGGKAQSRRRTASGPRRREVNSPNVGDPCLRGVRAGIDCLMEMNRPGDEAEKGEDDA